MINKPLRLSDYLQSGKTFAALQAQARQHEALLLRVRGLLPAPLDLHCLAVAMKERQLLIYADSPAWASRLRYLSRDLLNRLRQDGLVVVKITVRVIIERHPHIPKQYHARHLSGKNAELILQMADDITDPELGAALRRLGRHVEDDPGPSR